MEHWWNDTGKGKTKVLEKKKPVLISLCLPHISHELTWN